MCAVTCLGTGDYLAEKTGSEECTCVGAGDNRSTNRGRLSPVYVYVQESRPSIDILCGSYTNSYMAMLNFTCPALLKGDVLWVEVRGTYKVLTICEVKVYGWEL